MKRILITDSMDKNAISSLKDMGYDVVEKYYQPEELGTQLKDFDALIVRSATKVTKDVIDKALITRRLQLIVRSGVGLDNIDVEYAEKNGIMVTNTPNASSVAVAELAIAHMFALARFTYCSTETMREGKWNKKEYVGTELYGKTLGLIGFGRIARETARIAKGIGMDVTAFDPYITDEKFSKYGVEKCEILDELLKKSDIISLHIPYDKGQGAVIGAKEFDLMRDGVYLINCARGGVVSEKALLAALNSGKAAGVALDVFEEEPTKNTELCTHSRVSLTPHIGASTFEAQHRIGIEIIEIISNHFKKKL